MLGSTRLIRSFLTPCRGIKGFTVKEPLAAGHTASIREEKGIYHKEIPFGNWRSGRAGRGHQRATLLQKGYGRPEVVPYVPEGHGERYTFHSEITGEWYQVEASEYALTRIAECGGIDSYVLDHTEEELDSQFPGELKRCILQIIEQQRVSSEPIAIDEAVKQALKLEAILGFTLTLTDSLVCEARRDIEEEDELEGLLD